MPRYEFMCQQCKKAFELTMTISERGKGEVKCPTCKGTEGGAAARVLYDADVKEELSVVRADTKVSPVERNVRRANSTATTATVARRRFITRCSRR